MESSGRFDERLPRSLALVFAELGRRVPWGDIHDFDHLDDRVSMANACFVMLIGVDLGSVSWCPNDSPPALDEILVWIWVCRPELAPDIVNCAGEELREAIREYPNR